MENTNLELNFISPIVVADGQTIQTADNGMVQILFWQGRNQDQQSLKADVVAAVRYATLDDLKALNKTIEEAIKKHETREK